jgi:Mor family transcriptional regulator
MDRVYRFKPKQPKFSQDKAHEIREGHNRGCSYRELAQLYRTDKNTVLAICRQRGAYSKYRNWVQTGET